MDKDEIRQTLSGYRPELYSDDDPLIAESLAAAKNDPELTLWLEQEIASDQAIAQALAQIEPPTGAREALLETYADSLGKESSVGSRKANPRYWSRSAWAVAALLLITATGLIRYFAFPPPVEFVQSSDPSHETLREQMAFFASQRFVLDQTFKTNRESAAWLAQEDFPSLEELPAPLLKYKGMGCKKIEWQGRKVGLICFQDENKDLVHLFVAEREGLRIPEETDAQFGNILVQHERETKGSMSGDQVFVLVGSEPGVKIGNLL